MLQDGSFKTAANYFYFCVPLGLELCRSSLNIFVVQTLSEWKDNRVNQCLHVMELIMYVLFKQRLCLFYYYSKLSRWSQLGLHCFWYIVTGSISEVTITGLKPETSYEVKLSAINGKGEGESSPTEFFKTEPVSKWYKLLYIIIIIVIILPEVLSSMFRFPLLGHTWI